MRDHGRKTCMLLTAALCCATRLVGQNAQHQQLQTELADFRSSSWEVRERAFYELAAFGCPRCHNSQFPITDGVWNAIRSDSVPRGVITEALVDLLQTESAREKSESALSEEYVSYVGDLLMVVSTLDDKTSIPVLFEFVESGNMAEDGLARLGDASLSTAASQLAVTNDDSKRTALLRVIRKMSEPRNLQHFVNPEVSRAQIKSMLIQALSEKDPFARIEAVEGLANLGDPDLRPLVAAVAKNDPYLAPDRANHPVRESAVRALSRMK